MASACLAALHRIALLRRGGAALKQHRWEFEVILLLSPDFGPLIISAVFGSDLDTELAYALGSLLRHSPTGSKHLFSHLLVPLSWVLARRSTLCSWCAHLTLKL